ncbi:MAG: hypothetical protein LBT09_03865 [Planctomycetaceae bacterium]|nr:hypothetical protein [Planctomycetaceae bacterium]
MKNIVSIIFVTLIMFVLIGSVDAQPIRKLIRRMLDSDSPESYRVGQQDSRQSEEPQPSTGKIDKKRLLERAVRTINLFANNGSELKPVIVLSLASFDDYKKTMHTVTEQIRREHGNNDPPAVFDGLLNLYEQFISKHFDSQQPFGLILQTDGVLYYPLIFMPLNADSKIIQKLENSYVEKLDNGRYAIKQDTIKWPLGRLYVQQHNGWIFIATEFQLDSLPDEPAKLLPQSDEDNNLLTARFDLKNVPQLATRAALSLAEVDAVSKAETVIEKATARLSIGHIRSLAEQAEFLEYTFSYDTKKNDYVFREIEIARPNTEQAKLLRQRREVTSPFHSFYLPENAILASHLAFNMTQLQRTQYEIILDEAVGQYLLTTEERNELKSQKPKQNRIKNKSENSENSGTPIERNQKNIQTNSRDRLAALLELGKDNANENVAGNELSADKRAIEINGNQITGNGESYLPEFPLGVGGKSRDGNGEINAGIGGEKNGEKNNGIELGGNEKLSDVRKLEIMLRRIGVCYYWGLLGSIRSGRFDVAATWSDEHGIFGAFKITEGERFQKAFDSMFADMAEEFPDVYSAAVRKDYRQIHGFKLTRVSVRLADLLKWSAAGFFVTENTVTENTGGGINILLAVRQDAVCYSICRADDFKKQEQQLANAIEGTEKSLPVYDIFFVFSAYELGKTYAKSGNPNRFAKLKSIAANTSPNAVIHAKTDFTENSKTITIRANAILTPSLWRLKENFK